MTAIAAVTPDWFQSPSAEQRAMSKLGRGAIVALVFALGVAVGCLVCVVDRRRPAPPIDYTQPITIRRADDKVLYLVPYAVAIDGRSERLREMDESTRWIIWHNGARVQVAYTEQSPPK